jgi:4-hydroxy-tetrahydrodipicolinate synthase
MNFGKVITAMVTPFDQNGQIDWQGTEQLVNHLLANGTDAIVVAGTTGESPTLSTNEKVQLFKHVVSIVDNRAIVIAGTGSNNTMASIELTKMAESAGVDAIMLVAPYYNKPSQEGLYQHFNAISTATNLPVMIYNIPGRSAVNISVDTTIRLSKIDNIVATKEASGDLDAMAQIIEGTDDNFSLYSGDDTLTLPILAIGGRGIVSVSSHIIGNEMQAMVTEFLKGNIYEAASIHRKLLPIMKSLFTAPNPSPVKAALNMKGIHVGSVRLPLVPLTNEEQQQLKFAVMPEASFHVC